MPDTPQVIDEAIEQHPELVKCELQVKDETTYAVQADRAAKARYN